MITKWPWNLLIFLYMATYLLSASSRIVAAASFLSSTPAGNISSTGLRTTSMSSKLASRNIGGTTSITLIRKRQKTTKLSSSIREISMQKPQMDSDQSMSTSSDKKPYRPLVIVIAGPTAIGT